MNWVDIISKTICYIESNIFEDIKINDIAKEIYIAIISTKRIFYYVWLYNIRIYKK